MTTALLLLVAAVVCHLKSARTVATENAGHNLPIVYGANPVRPSRRARRFQAAGWILSLVGSLRVGDELWLHRPGWSVFVALTLLVLVNSVPALTVTLLHNSNVRAQS